MKAAQIQKGLNELARLAISGERSALETYGDLKLLGKTVESLLKQVQTDALFEMDSSGDNSVERNGVKFTLVNNPKTYNFKLFPEWEAEKQRLKNLEEMYKAAWQATQKGMIAATDAGEVIEIPDGFVSGGGTSIRVAIAK